MLVISCFIHLVYCNIINYHYTFKHEHKSIYLNYRIVTDHGVAGRYPYLDENVVSFLNELPLNVKMNLTVDRGLGEKILLRAVAYNLGLKKTSGHLKRAIQFGSRIAKLENRKEKASDTAIR